MNLREIQKLVFKEYIKNGYDEFWNKVIFPQQKISNIAELGMINTEISEAIEWVFKDGDIKDIFRYWYGYWDRISHRVYWEYSRVFISFSIGFHTYQIIKEVS